MKRLFRVLLILSVMLPILAAPVSAAKQDKVTICHNPNDKKQITITVSGNALAAHLAHGDAEGQCN